MYEVLRKGRIHNLSIKCQLDLFDKIVKPILLYGCEIWGFGKNDIIESVHLKFCKFLLRLKVSTPNFMVNGELGSQAEILQFKIFLTYNSLYAIVDNFDCFPYISLHQYEIILTLISISSGYLPNSPFTIKLGVDTFRRNKNLQNFKWTLSIISFLQGNSQNYLQ
jgi:hypothetical protein